MRRKFTGFRPYFDTENDFVEFLSGTLIPDLEEDGKRQMANDFKEAVYWIMSNKQTKKPAKRRQSPKQKILTEMTDKKWKQYKKGSGKKTYVQIRAMVSRSQAYKRKVKNL